MVVKMTRTAVLAVDDAGRPVLTVDIDESVPEDDPECIRVRHAGQTISWWSVEDVQTLRAVLAELVDALREQDASWPAPGPDPLDPPERLLNGDRIGDGPRTAEGPIVL